MTMGPPIFMILGGINGAGKSTFVQIIRQSPGLADAPIMNPDVVAAEMRQADPSLDLASADFRAMRRVQAELRDHLAAGRNVVAETVLANLAYRNLCLDAQGKGYEVRLVFVGLRSPEESISRVAVRVGKGGHNVAEVDIRRRWPKVHENLTWFARHADWVDVFDNSGYGLAPRHIASARKGTVEFFDADALPLVTEALRRVAAEAPVA